MSTAQESLGETIATPTPKVEAKSKVYLALLAVQIFFGIHYYAAKQVLGEIPAPVWASLRVTGAAILMMLICLPRARRSFPKSGRDIGMLAVFSFFGVILNQICFTEGLARSVPTHSAIINSLIPISTLSFAILLGRESYNMKKLISIAISVSGVLYLLKVDQFQLDNKYIVGDLLTLLNGLSFAFFLVISKELVMRYDSFVATTILLTFGSIGISAYGFKSLLVFDPHKVSPHIWLWAAFIIIFPTVLAYFFNYWALRRVESSLVAFFIYVQPPLAASLSIMAGYEKLTARLVISAVVIFLGFLFSYSPPTHNPPIKSPS